ncbi:hypothetical protein [Nostoc sp. C117]|uniref:hypothetical protein n=1 Tax=Nostoc sp. C117 TaxID=3349875 RepID=UPI00370D1678
MNYQNREEKTKNMFLKSRVTAAIFTTVFALSSVSLATSVKAENEPQKFSCTNRTIQGNYASNFTGVNFANGSSVNSFLGLSRFDGNGNIASVKSVLAINGQITRYTNEFTGTYKVNSDCTVDVFLTGAGRDDRWFGIIVDHGEKVLYLETDAGASFAGSWEKVSGSYRF